MKKRGINLSLKAIIIIVSILLITLIGLRVWHGYCEAPEKEANFIVKSISWLSQCDDQSVGPIDKVFRWGQNLIGFKQTKGPVAWTQDVFGFNQGIYEFFWPGLPWGLFIGALIHLSYLGISWATRLQFLAKFQAYHKPRDIKHEKTKIQSSWLNLIGGQWWKIVPIGILIAIFMQIPFVYTFINIITFEPLGLNWIFQGVLMAFYLGLLPGAIESYSRYKLRMKYYKKIMTAKYGVRTARGMASG